MNVSIPASKCQQNNTIKSHIVKRAVIKSHCSFIEQRNFTLLRMLFLTFIWQLAAPLYGKLFFSLEWKHLNEILT